MGESMLVQMTLTRNELFLLREVLPIWTKYADGFVFMDDDSTDGTYEFLQDNAKKYNILSVLQTGRKSDSLVVESNIRQRLFDESLKHSPYLTCLDTDEYIDGAMTHEQLKEVLAAHKGYLVDLLWVQYTGPNQIRVDGPWGRAWSPDRLGSYFHNAVFPSAQMHSQHMPYGSDRKTLRIPPPHLFISHLQWIDKKAVAIKQYYWKVVDYVNRLKFGAKTIDSREYDASVNNFVWSTVEFPFPLKVRPDIYQTQDISDNYKYQFIKESVAKYSIPNLNDWGMGIH